MVYPVFFFPHETIFTIYLKSDCKTRKVMKCVSSLWRSIGENSNYKLRIVEGIRSLNSILKIRGDIDIQNSDTIEMVQTKVKTYQLAIVNLLHPKRKGIASLPLSLINPVSCYLRNNTYHKIYWRMLDFIDSLASKNNTKKDDLIIEKMIERSNRGCFEHALLLLDCTQADNKNKEILNSVITTHIQNNEHPSAIRLLELLLLQKSNLQIQQQARRLFVHLISQVKDMNIKKLELVCIKYECLTVVAETFKKMEDVDQSKKINNLIGELKSSIPQNFLDALEQDVIDFSLQLRWAGKDFGKEIYEVLRNAALKISNPKEKTTALLKLMQVLRSAKRENPEWIEEVEGFLGLRLFGNLVSPEEETMVSTRSRQSLLFEGLTVAATQMRDHAIRKRQIQLQQTSFNQIIACLIETEDEEKRKALFLYLRELLGYFEET